MHGLGLQMDTALPIMTMCLSLGKCSSHHVCLPFAHSCCSSSLAGSKPQQSRKTWPASSCTVHAEYCTEVRKSGPQCSMKFRHEAGRLSGTPMAAPGPGQYATTTCTRPRSAAFTFGCSRPQSGSQTARCAHGIGCSRFHTHVRHAVVARQGSPCFWLVCLQLLCMLHIK